MDVKVEVVVVAVELVELVLMDIYYQEHENLVLVESSELVVVDYDRTVE